MLIGVVHDHHHAADPGDKIHCAAHALDQLARNHPIGKVAVFGNFHCAKNGHRDLAAPDHSKGLRTVKISGLW